MKDTEKILKQVVNSNAKEQLENYLTGSKAITIICKSKIDEINDRELGEK